MAWFRIRAKNTPEKMGNAHAVFWKDTLVICREFHENQIGAMKVYSITLGEKYDGESEEKSVFLQGNQIPWTKPIEPMFLSEAYVDVSFRCEGQIIPAHKVILATRCKYFDRMFTSKFAVRKL